MTYSRKVQRVMEKLAEVKAKGKIMIPSNICVANELRRLLSQAISLMENAQRMDTWLKRNGGNLPQHCPDAFQRSLQAIEQGIQDLHGYISVKVNNLEINSQTNSPTMHGNAMESGASSGISRSPQPGTSRGMSGAGIVQPRTKRLECMKPGCDQSPPTSKCSLTSSNCSCPHCSMRIYSSPSWTISSLSTPSSLSLD